MYETKHPRRALFSWSSTNSFAFHLPNATAPRQLICLSQVRPSKPQPTKLISSISNLYDFHCRVVSDYEIQLGMYLSSLDPIYHPLTVSSQRRQEKRQLFAWKRGLARKTMSRMAKRVQEAIQHQKGGTANTLEEMYYLFMSFVTNVRIEPESDSNQQEYRPLYERLVMWMSEYWMEKPICKNAVKAPENINIFGYFVTGKYEELIKELEDLIHEKNYTNTSRDYKVIKSFESLICKKLKYYGGSDCFYLARSEFIDNFITVQKEAAQLLTKTNFTIHERNNPIYLMLSVLSGDMNEITRFCSLDWKLFVFIYILYCQPCSDFYDLHKALYSFMNQQQRNTLEAQLALRMFQQSAHCMVEACFLAELSPVLCSTFGILCCDMGLMALVDKFDGVLLDKQNGYKNQMLEFLVEWIQEADWELVKPYAIQYSNSLPYNVRDDYLIGIFDKKFEIKEIKTQKDYQLLCNHCEDIAYLHLDYYLSYFLNSILIRQIKNSCMKYVLQIVSLTSKYTMDKESIKNVFKWCIEQLNDEDFDYSELIQQINRWEDTESLSRIEIEKLFSPLIELDKLRKDLRADEAIPAYNKVLAWTKKSFSETNLSQKYQVGIVLNKLTRILNILIERYGKGICFEMLNQTKIFVKNLVLKDTQQSNLELLRNLEQL